MPDEVVKTPPKPKGVSQKEFQEFQTQVLEALKELKSQPQVVADSSGVYVAPKVVEEGGPQSATPVPPKWRELTSEILGTDFQIELELPENGGQKFSVFVPLEKSNAGKDHWERERKDKRTRELANSGVKGVRSWLISVRKNLIGSGIKLPYWEDTDPRQSISLR